MFRKIVDVLKEVFWMKPSRKKSKPVRKSVKKVAVKKKIARKPLKAALKQKLKAKAKPKVPAKPKAAVKIVDPSLVELGEITHYFERIKVCVVKLTQGTVLIGDKLTIIGPKTRFVQKVWSMQIESEDVKVAKKGQLIGLKVDKLVAVGDKVYK
jgi:translation initiation factor IF-2